MSKKGCTYDLTEVPEGVHRPATPAERDDLSVVKWSADVGEIPKIGARVKIRMSHLGPGTVVGYFVEHGWLGVKVRLDVPPDWHKEQHPGDPHALVFGAELEQRGRRLAGSAK